ncbi:hypothetical protein NX059_003062 [Plenodomus lindquistii]|nr:hypothetical protein NX059_003062 [Plenodomus lindquistii]
MATSKTLVGQRSHPFKDSDEEDNSNDDNHLRSSQQGSNLSLFIPENSDSDELEPLDEDLLDSLHAEYIAARPTHTSHSHYSAMEGLERARAIKAEIKDYIPVLQPQANKNTMRHTPQEDPENVLIKTLRDEEKMKWSEIVKRLNSDRREREEPVDFTDQKVYGRYVQTNASIVFPIREIGFDPHDYLHLQSKTQGAEGGPILGSISKNARKRLKNPLNPTELKANLRQVVEMDKAKDLETPEKSEQLMRAVERVERNFWVLVADEMERATTKLYDPETLAERYHAI